MRRLPRPVRLDFVASVHEAPLAGAALCALGVSAAIALGLAFSEKLAERSRLDGALSAATAHKPRARAPTPESLKRAAESAMVERELDVPWSRLLADLEAASRDKAGSISLLNVEPDAVKQVVRITAEVRELPDALTYLQRLQKSAVLRYPMLESHERRKDDPDHPLRIRLSAEWLK
jgi:hypothetical protein